MKANLFKSFLSIFLLWASLVSFTAAQTDDGELQRQAYIVVFKERSESYDLASNKRRPIREKLAARYPGKIKQHFRHVLKGATVRLNPFEAQKLALDPDVAVVEPVLIFKTQTVSSWGLDRIDQRDLPLDDSYQRDPTAYPVHVYVVDSGLQSSHQEIADRIGDSHFDATGGDGQDCSGHGTHVASIIAGQTYGVTHTARLHNVKVLTCNGQGEGVGTTTDILAGLDWIAENAQLPAVVNMSLGATGLSSTVNSAVKDLIDRGITVVAAAGNFDDDACGYSPAGFNPVLTVGASTRQDARALFSNDGPCIDMFAPGEDIIGADISADNAVAMRSGTSMAAAHVTGIVAELLRDYPTLCPGSVNAELGASASDGRLSGVTGPNKLACLEYDPDLNVSACASENNTVYDGFQKMEPCGWYYAGPGRHEGRLIVPDNANFDLYLEMSANGAWVEVKTSRKGAGQDEKIIYNGQEGMYRWRIKGVNGTGAYRFYWKKP